MATRPAIYQHYADNVAKLATITIQTGTSTGDPNYAPEKLVDDNPAQVAKIISASVSPATAAAWLLDFGTAQRVDLIALIHHSFDAGANVKIQANTSDSWASPAFSCAITIPTWLGTGTRRWPVNPWLDLTAATPLIGTYNTTGWRYWRLIITGNSQDAQLGQLWMSPTIRRFNPGLRLGFGESRVKPIIDNRTAFGVDTLYTRGTTRYGLTVVFNAMNDTMRAAIRAQWEDVDGRTYPWLFVPDGLANNAFLVRWLTTTEQMDRILPTYSRVALAIEEVSRGLRPGV